MEQLEGAVASIIFQSADQGFSVFAVQSPGTGKVTAVFKGPAPFLGENIVAQGCGRNITALAGNLPFKHIRP
jgi:exodeoxyribonuclease V alpha subunit